MVILNKFSFKCKTYKVHCNCVSETLQIRLLVIYKCTKALKNEKVGIAIKVSKCYWTMCISLVKDTTWLI